MTAVADERWFDGHPKRWVTRWVWLTPLAFTAGALIGVTLL